MWWWKCGGRSACWAQVRTGGGEGGKGGPHRVVGRPPMSGSESPQSRIPHQPRGAQAMGAHGREAPNNAAALAFTITIVGVAHALCALPLPSLSHDPLRQQPNSKIAQTAGTPHPARPNILYQQVTGPHLSGLDAVALRAPRAQRRPHHCHLHTGHTTRRWAVATCATCAALAARMGLVPVAAGDLTSSRHRVFRV